MSVFGVWPTKPHSESCETFFSGSRDEPAGPLVEFSEGDLLASEGWTVAQGH